MKKLKGLFLAIILLPKVSYAQDPEVMDSIVSQIGKQIRAELIADGYNVMTNMLYGNEMLGSVIQLESYDISSKPMLIYSIGVSDKKYQKSVRTEKFPYVRRYFYWQYIRNSINTQRVLPVKNLKYIFIAMLQDYPSDVVVYGEYQFLFNEDEKSYKLINKHNELYEGDDAIKTLFELRF